MRSLLLTALVVFTSLTHITARQDEAAQAPAPTATPPPGTDIYLLALRNGVSSLQAATPVPIATAPGYDNQPLFSADGSRILFSANRDGKQTDVYLYDRASGRVSQVTQTPENENSPTFLPVGVGGEVGGFSVVRTETDRTQRLWRFDAEGRNPQLVLTDIKPVGYHAWVDADRLALFVLGDPNSLQLASVKTGAGEVVTQGIGRSLHRVPGTRFVSFVQREPSGEFWIKQIAVDSQTIEPLTKVPDGAGERDMAWMGDGKTILLSAGSKVLSWTRAAAGWTEVFDAAPHKLGAVSRLAVSPRGDAVAIVVAEPSPRK